MAFQQLGGGHGYGDVQAIQAQANDDDANFNPSGGRVERREARQIDPAAVDPLAGRDVNAEQDRQDEEELEARRAENEESLKVYEKLSPEEVFLKFDTDGSGFIDFDEYKDMLPQLGINITEAKARKYFSLADTDGSGEIDFEEFKIAMFAVDPDTGNATGFAPNSLLSPLDAFEMFDEDGSGKIDEDEFFFVLQYMGLNVSDQKQDQLFAKYDTDGSGTLEYDEFKQIWLRCANVKKELSDRGIQYPKFSTRAALERMLEKVLDQEEDSEAHALAEAKQFRAWQASLREKKRLLYRAQRRAKVELRNSLDLAGQVYTFGTGTFGQFDGSAMKDISTKNAPFTEFNEIFDLWHGRLHPDESFLIRIGAEERKKVSQDPEDDEEKLEIGKNLDVSDPRTEVLTSFFREVLSPSNTAALWGKRIIQVSLAENVAMALSDLGEVYAWGGTSHWWHEIEEDAVWQHEWRGDLTPRSRNLVGVMGQEEPEEDVLEVEADPDDELADKFKVVLTYFGKWQPPPLPTERLKFYKDVQFPKIPYDGLKLACEIRGQRTEEKTKLDLLAIIHSSIELEKRVLGERTHRRIRELEEEVTELKKRKKNFMAKKLTLDCQQLWEPLLHMQAQEQAENQANERRQQELKNIETENKYVKWRDTIHNARLDGEGRYTARGTSLDLAISGFTARGGGMQTPRGYQKAVVVNCGANHAALVHQNGQLYTWGFGVSGRLGHSLSGNQEPHEVSRPAVVQALAGRPVLRVSCGYSHTAVVTVDGRVYVWGSSATGKLGVGNVSSTEESFCPIPTPITVGARSRIRRISCGSAHTGCVTETGAVFMWGCGDGGRLGLGADRLGTQHVPAQVQALADVKVAGIDCGNTHTILCTVIQERFEGQGASRIKVQIGGDVWVAGPQNVLGRFCPEFSIMQEFKGTPIRTVAAGFNHSAAVTLGGQLYCWGNNMSGCCGAPLSTRFVYEPMNLRCINQAPRNLALGRSAQQSSIYGGLGPYLAADGNVQGDNANFCMSTQSEAQPWWEVDLGDFSVISTIKLWNRDDEPTDPAFERDMFRNRLFPCYVLLSADPMPRNEPKKESNDLARGDGEPAQSPETNLQLAINTSVARVKLTKLQRCTTWHVPANTSARYVRIQLEGFDFLHFAQVEVLGTPGMNKPVGKCGFVECGRNVTVALVRPTNDPKDIDKAYRKAVSSDSFNADMLRQYETFSLAYDKYGRGERIKRCLVCRGNTVCEACELKNTFKDELQQMPLGIGGALPTLDQIGEFLLNAPKPELDYKPPERKEKTMLGRFAEDFSDVFGSIKDPGDDDAESKATDAGSLAESQQPNAAENEPGNSKSPQEPQVASTSKSNDQAKAEDGGVPGDLDNGKKKSRSGWFSMPRLFKRKQKDPPIAP